MTNKINQYIINKGFRAPKEIDKTGKISEHIAYRNGKGHPEGVVVHETANPTSTITGEISYMQGNYNDAFVHEFVDSQKIIGVADTDYQAWGAGHTANSRYVQFEQVRVHSKDDFAKELLNGATFVVNTLKKYKLKPSKSTIVTHHQTSNMFHETDHTDPDAYWSASARKWFGTTYKIADFIWLVKHIYDGKKVAKPAYYTGIKAGTKIKVIKDISIWKDVDFKKKDRDYSKGHTFVTKGMTKSTKGTPRFITASGKLFTTTNKEYVQVVKKLK